MEQMRRFLNVCVNILMVLASAILILMMVHICLDVAGKYLLHRPIVGTLEIVSWYYMVACIFFPVAYVQMKRGHLMVEMFTLRLSNRTNAVIDGLVAVLALVYLSLLTYLVFHQALNSTIGGEAQDLTFFDMPVWPARWILPISFGLMVLVIAFQGCLDLLYGFFGIGKSTLLENKEAPAFLD